MGIQESINSALGTASSIASKVTPDKAQEKTGFKTKTSDFRNFDNKTVNKSAQSLKREIEGKKAQGERIKKRRSTVTSRMLEVNTDKRNFNKVVL